MKGLYQVSLNFSDSGPQQVRGIDVRTTNLPAKAAFDVASGDLYWHDNEPDGLNVIKRMSLTGDLAEHSLTVLAHGSHANNNNNQDDIYGAVIMAHPLRETSSPGSFDECRLSAEVAANPQTKPTDVDCESARKKWQLSSTFTIAILLLLSPRADTPFTVPRRVEG